jgi:hypothetical protein
MPENVLLVILKCEFVHNSMQGENLNEKFQPKWRFIKIETRKTSVSG